MTLQEEAVLWLESRGKKLGEDFTLDGAIGIADDIAFEEKAAQQKALGGLIEFDGGCDGDEPCGGWDMESRRCECGNRRVSWSTGMGHSFKKPYIYAEAY